MKKIKRTTKKPTVQLDKLNYTLRNMQYQLEKNTVRTKIIDDMVTSELLES